MTQICTELQKKRIQMPAVLQRDIDVKVRFNYSHHTDSEIQESVSQEGITAMTESTKTDICRRLENVFATYICG